MVILGVETSAVAAGAAIIKDDKLLGECFLNAGLTHSQTLMPLIDNVIKISKININDIDLLAVSDGPGSFTGLRIGVGTIKGLAFGLEKPVCGVSPLKALAYNVPLAPGIIAPIMDARRGEVYNALYKWDNNNLVEITPPRAISIEELAMELPEGAIFLGDGAPPYMDRLTEILGEKARFAPINLMYQRASSIAMAAIHEKAISAEELLPTYIRKPQAERELERRNSNDSIR